MKIYFTKKEVTMLKDMVMVDKLKIANSGLNKNIVKSIEETLDSIERKLNQSQVYGQ